MNPNLTSPPKALFPKDMHSESHPAIKSNYYTKETNTPSKQTTTQKKKKKKIKKKHWEKKKINKQNKQNKKLKNFLALSPAL